MAATATTWCSPRTVNTIIGTGHADLVDASHTVAGQPLPTDGADLIKGKGGADDLSGLAGADTILGGKGGDYLYGNNGSSLAGGAGDDHLYGGAGNDVLNGGKGRDHLTGGDGDDAFVFDTPLGPNNVGIIADFGKGHDTFYLDGSIFQGIGGPGGLAKEHFVVAVQAKTADEHILYNHDNGKLYYDEDGAGGVNKILFAKVDPHTHLTHHDFFVI